ncbi:hypothetical protein [Novosphingobium sp. TCA1]|uniref:hypothetical protein n=1 Tax=Novosphingobium sp. TCA1 TaxID=2682474 RepID=UPI00130B66CF|nr:hypothetical protein [Novosphingobium sp. TCA1]GFE76254.1 hypothetical protein NTCA1_39030 [Novosphingobium sp. TCA1]
MELRPILETAAEFLGSLSPSLLGSAVAQAWKPGLSYRQRFVQWAVGSTVSYYATLAIVFSTGWDGLVAQSIGFGIALLAYDATPKVAKAAIDTLASLPARLADRFLPKKD